MVIRVDVVNRCVEHVNNLSQYKGYKILLSARGNLYNQEKAWQLAEENEGLILICGHYKGVDERVKLVIADEAISIGDYILTGGEIPAMVIIDSIIRLIPGVLGNLESAEDDSFYKENLLGPPYYTHPFDFNGHKVPKILISGNHKEILKWRKLKAEELTQKIRPDIWLKYKSKKESEKDAC